MPFPCIIVMPAYNEEGCIARMITDWTSELDKIFKDQFRIIIINDGSTDGTKAILDSLMKENNCLLVSHQVNQGHGASVINGYNQALALNSEYIFQTDSDNQFDAADFIKLWQRRSESKFILGFREIRHDAWHRIFISKVTSLLVFILFAVRIKDSNVPYRLMQADFLRQLLPSLPSGVFIPNICLAIAAARRGQKLLHIPVHHKKRKTGSVSIVKWNLIKACCTSLVDVLRFRMMLVH